MPDGSIFASQVADLTSPRVPPCPSSFDTGMRRAWERAHKDSFSAEEYLTELEAAGGRIFDWGTGQKRDVVFFVPGNEEASTYFQVWVNLARQREAVVDEARSSGHWDRLEVRSA